MDRIKFIQYAAPIVKKQGAKILPSLTLAQIIIEAFKGEQLTELADVPNHNLFGIKGEGTAGVCQMITHEYVNKKKIQTVALFRRYNNWEESITDHYKLLTNAKRYKGVIGEKDLAIAAYKIWAAGYCTNANYPNLIVSVAKKYNLTQYDK